MCNSPEKILNKYLYWPLEYWMSDIGTLKIFFCLRHHFSEKEIWSEVKYSGFEDEKKSLIIMLGLTWNRTFDSKKNAFPFLTPHNVSDFQRKVTVKALLESDSSGTSSVMLRKEGSSCKLCQLALLRVRVWWSTSVVISFSFFLFK